MAITYTTGAPQGGGVDPILEKGRYTFRVADAEEKKSKAGNPMIEFKARHLKEDGTTGRAVYGNLVFAEKALWKVDQFAAACGKHPGEGEDLTLDAEEMVGWEFVAEVEVTKDDKGRDRNEFTAFILAEEEGF
jgi:hypothetical protein